MEESLLRIAKFCWRSENDPKFGATLGDNVLVFWGPPNSGKSTCADALLELDLATCVGKRYDGILASDWHHYFNWIVPLIYVGREPLAFPNAHVVHFAAPTHRQPALLIRKQIRALLQTFSKRIFLVDESRLVPQLCLQLRRRFGDREILESALPLDLKEEILRFRFHAR